MCQATLGFTHPARGLGPATAPVLHLSETAGLTVPCRLQWNLVSWRSPRHREATDRAAMDLPDSLIEVAVLAGPILAPRQGAPLEAGPWIAVETHRLRGQQMLSGLRLQVRHRIGQLPMGRWGGMLETHGADFRSFTLQVRSYVVQDGRWQVAGLAPYPRSTDRARIVATTAK